DQAGAATDLEGLRSFDSNANGFFDGGDARFGDFRVWRDANQDGVSQTDELFTLSQLNIRAINLTVTPTGATPAGQFDNVIVGHASYIRADGTTGDVGDVKLAYLASD